MNIRNASPLLLMAVFLSGCATVSVEKYYDNGKYPAKSPDQVKIFREIPPRPYQVLGTAFNAVLGGTFEDDTQKLKVEAAAMGADAIIEVVKESNCRMAVVDPEKTIVKENSDQDATRVISKPAEYEKTCDETYEHQMIRFTD